MTVGYARLTLVGSVSLTVVVVTPDSDSLQDAVDGDDGVRPVGHVDDPLRLTVEGEEAVDGHDTEVGGEDDSIHEVRLVGPADLERRRLD